MMRTSRPSRDRQHASNLAAVAIFIGSVDQYFMDTKSMPIFSSQK